MKSIVFITCSVFIFISCRDNSKKNQVSTDIPATNSSSIAIDIDSSTLFMDSSKEILQAIKNHDFKIFARYIHPVSGIRFSPYGNIDVVRDVTFSADQFIQQYQNGNKINWGNYDGSGAPIMLSVEEYFKKFVYNADFLNAEITNFDKISGDGNSLNNLEKVYKKNHFIQSYFSGRDKKYNGMDWTSLVLVFKNYGNKIYLIAIVHDQWTI
ncbi:MAG: hypothetical protein ABI148_04095 [Ginsengibacter sp.]